MKNNFFKIVLVLCLYANSYSQEKTTFDEIIDENKGKLIYVDFWASWCKPCRKEMKDMPKLHKYYENKDVIFVYLSIDLDEKKWIQISNKEGISDKKYNLLTVKMKKTDDFKLSKKFDFKINAIPRYMLFDKNGELVNSNAPRPSEKKELINLMDNYLLK